MHLPARRVRSASTRAGGQWFFPGGRTQDRRARRQLAGAAWAHPSCDAVLRMLALLLLWLLGRGAPVAAASAPPPPPKPQDLVSNWNAGCTFNLTGRGPRLGFPFCNSCVERLGAYSNGKLAASDLLSSTGRCRWTCDYRTY